MIDFKLKPHDKVFVHTAACNPQVLLEELCQYVLRTGIAPIHVYHLHLEGSAPHVAKNLEGKIITHCFFVGANCRSAVNEKRAHYIPMFLSEIPLAFSSGLFSFDLALMHLSSFDKRGYATLGPSVDVSLAAMLNSKRVMAQINPKMPRVYGEGIVHKSRLDFILDVDTFLPTGAGKEDEKSMAIYEAIGKHVATLIDDGATLQMGIGAIPDAVLSQLSNRKNLGIHTEMISDGVIDLIESGAVDNRLKTVVPGKIVSSFALGSQKLYDYLDSNPLFNFMSSERVNSPSIIQKNPKVCAINSAIEIDLSGQVCADSIGHSIFSGVGGQVDFMRGAALSPGGKAIIALPSQTKSGKSKIVYSLKEGAGVVSTRAHVHYVVTEYGVAYLHGKSIAQRAEALIAVAHPDHRKQLAAVG